MLMLAGLSHACKPRKPVGVAIQNARRLFMGGAIRSIILFRTKKKKKVGRAQRAQRAAQLAVAAAFRFKLCMQANETGGNCNAKRV